MGGLLWTTIALSMMESSKSSRRRLDDPTSLSKEQAVLSSLDWSRSISSKSYLARIPLAYVERMEYMMGHEREAPHDPPVLSAVS